MKLWFKTEENQIIDLNDMKSFWIEEVKENRIFCIDSKDITWNIANFDECSKAQRYLCEIYSFLKGDI